MTGKKVELPQDCIITDRRTWERQQREAAKLRHEHGQLARRVQALQASNEALRRQLGESEELTIKALSDAEDHKLRADRSITITGTVKRALKLAEEALDRVSLANHRNAYGGTVGPALRAVRKAIAQVRG